MLTLEGWSNESWVLMVLPFTVRTAGGGGRNLTLTKKLRNAVTNHRPIGPEKEAGTEKGRRVEGQKGSMLRWEFLAWTYRL